MSVLVAIGVDKDGYRRILGVQEGHKEDRSGWGSFLAHLKERGLTGVQLIISDACLGLYESAAECHPEADWQRCMVHFHRSVSNKVPSTKVKQVAMMLKAIYAQESLDSARIKVTHVTQQLRTMKLNATAYLIEDKIEETLTYYKYPPTHWIRDTYQQPAGANHERDQTTN